MNKLIYIAGYPRSGTTLLGNILAESHGAVAVGEPIFLPKSEITTGRCACGELFDDCNFWGFRQKLHKFDSFAHLPLTSFRSSLVFLLSGSFAFPNNYLQSLQDLYDSLYSDREIATVVDESKFPLYLYALLQLKKLDIRVIHLVRDPRAVAFSWMRLKSKAQAGKTMERYHPISTARRWMMDNWLLEKISLPLPRFFLRYEDFAAAPKETVMQLLNWAGMPYSDTFTSSFVVNFRKQHHLVASNPVGKKLGDLNIMPDDEWKTQMTSWHCWLVSAICWPLMLRYGYSK